MSTEATFEKYQFTLTLRGVVDPTEELRTRLREAGCDYVSLRYQGSTPNLDFSRAAETLGDAIGSAVKDVQRAGLVVGRIEMAPQVSPHGDPIAVEVMVRLQALALPEPEGGYSIVVPALPGCVSCCETIWEITGNVIEAAEGWLASQHDGAKEESVRVMTT